MKIGYVQNQPIFGEKEKNFLEVRNLLKDIEADLIVLPELFATGYTFTSKEEAETLAEDLNGETAQFLKELSIQTKGAIVAGFVEKEGGKTYNSSLIVSKGEVIDTYRKIHLFNKESLWFSKGNKPLKTYEIDGVKIGVMICFDWLFPEVTRTLTLQGTQVLAHPCNLVMPYCQKAMTTRCLENRIFAVTANRIGNEKRGEDDFIFTGGSQITFINGDILDSAPTDKTCAHFVEINPEESINKNINPYNHLIDNRRPEFYKEKSES